MIHRLFLLFFTNTALTAINAAILTRKGSLEQLPGVDVLGHGYDAKTGLTLGPIYSFTYEQKNTWSPPGNPLVQFLYPDQVFLTELDTFQSLIVETINAEYTERLSTYASYNMFMAGLRIGSFSLAYEHEKELADARAKLNGVLAVSALTEFNWLYYQLETVPPFVANLDPVFLATIAALPPTIQSQADYNKYLQTVQFFGTDVFTLGAFGGSIHQDAYINKQYSLSVNSSFLLEQTNWLVSYSLFAIYSGSFSNHDQIQMDATFLAEAVYPVYYKGGNPEYAGSNLTLAEWVLSVPTNAVNINSTFVPLAEFITDPQTSMTMTQFATNYVAGGSFSSFTEQNKVNQLGSEMLSGYNVVTGLITGIELFAKNQTDTYWCLPFPPFTNFSVDSNLITQTFTDSFLSNFSSVTNSSTDYQFQRYREEQWSSAMGFESHSKITIDYYERSQDKDQILSIFHADIGYLKMTLDLMPPPPLNYWVQQMIDRLIIPYNQTKQSKESYFEFFDYVGSAAIMSAEYGGSFVVRSWTQQSFLKEFSAEYVSEQASWNILRIIGNGHGHTSVSEHLSQYFQSMTEIEYEFKGGDIENIDVQKWQDQWVPNVYKRMQPVTKSLLPIYEILPLGHPKRESMKNALGEYLFSFSLQK